MVMISLMVNSNMLNSYDQSFNVILLLNVFLFFFSLRVRGQHTKTTGRRGRTVGVSKKK